MQTGYKSTNFTLSRTTVAKNVSHSESVQEPNKISRSLQTSSKELSFSDSQTVGFTESAPNPQTERKINTHTATSNLHIVIVDNITSSIIKASVNIKKYTVIQIHIKHTYELPKGGICVEVKSEEQKQLWIINANILFPG